MGVTGLLPVLKSVTDQVHVSKYAGKTVGVDASGWLYKGAYSCPVDLVMGRPTDAYLNFAVQHIKMLQDHYITPILVFDGAPLPSKAQENIARGRSRRDWRLKAKKMLQENDEDQDSRAVFSACTRAVSVTNDMVMSLIAVLRRMDITFYVAPYEADAQLAFLSRQKIVDVVISEDSDCVPYGVKTTLLKLEPDGWGKELKRRSLGANEELSFVGWTEGMFIQLCVLAGCDYCPSVPGVGIITAYKLVSKYNTPMKVLKALQQQKGSSLPEEFAEHFYSAILTYRHQLVFDPRDAKLKMLSPLDVSKDILPLVDKGLHFLGNVELRDDVVASIASGQIHPVTHESYVWKDTVAAVLLQEQQAASNPKSSRTRSSTSSESSEMIIPHRHQRDNQVAASANTPDDSSQEDPVSSARAAVSRVQYEKPRPSSRSSWTHLDSVLGSSDHIVNFRSPKVSENFKPLAALHDPPASIGSSIIHSQGLKEFETRPVRDHVKRVRNPTNRRRDGKGSGFEGEVLCRVEQGQTPSIGSSAEARRSAAAVDCDADRLTDEENAPPQQAKRPKLFGCPSSPRVSETGSQKQLARPTPFGCGQRPSSPTTSVFFNCKLPPRHSQQSRSIQPAAAKPASHYAFATSAEEKWDRILEDEIDDTTTSVSQEGGHEAAASPPSSTNTSSSSSRDQPLAPINKAG
ncbi:Rad2 nuclease [Phytophthora pseudosyringae]|uniref:Exonuclease 1 n=1 Tax=Phytophthora pseudosyringae TaxID=221518 RepID=A0A8T1VKH0_9STRA|nr:Rad2 nuclease [Phytophthora pseudosyringae]